MKVFDIPLLMEQIEEEISARITTELSAQIPILIEAALYEHLPQAVGARLQAEIMNSLAATLPAAAKTATEQIAGTLAAELGALLEQRLQSIAWWSKKSMPRCGEQPGDLQPQVP